MLATADEPQTDEPRDVPDALPESIRLKDALVQLRLDRSTFYRYAAKVDCPLVSFRHGRYTYVPTSAIEAYERYLIDDATNRKAVNARRKKK